MSLNDFSLIFLKCTSSSQGFFFLLYAKWQRDNNWSLGKAEQQSDSQMAAKQCLDVIVKKAKSSFDT